MSSQVPEKVKAERSRRALALSAKLSEDFRKYYEGTVREILLEEEQEIGGRRYMTGFTREYVKAAAELPAAGVPGPAAEEVFSPGQILPVRLSGRREAGWEELLFAEPLMK